MKHILDWQRQYRMRKNGVNRRDKLTEEDRCEIWERLCAGERVIDVAALFGVSPATVSRIKTQQRKVILK